VAAPKPKRATYQDVLDAPEHQVAEIVDGELFLSPRPAGPHTRVASLLGGDLMGPFDRGRGGPGGWIILDEPELHLGDDILVPDLAGWRRDRLPGIGNVAYFTVTPDWICEVLSPSTRRLDRILKLPIYASAGVRNAWLIDPIDRSLEVFRLHEGKWIAIATHQERARVRIEPFEAIELDLSSWWADLDLPPRACEPVALYETAL
jgi:Uma2 family endonuclease